MSVDFQMLGQRLANHPALMDRPLWEMNPDDLGLLACLFWDVPGLDLAFVGRELAAIELLQTPIRGMSRAEIRALAGVLREGVNRWEAQHDAIPI